MGLWNNIQYESSMLQPHRQVPLYEDIIKVCATCINEGYSHLPVEMGCSHLLYSICCTGVWPFSLFLFVPSHRQLDSYGDKVQRSSQITQHVQYNHDYRIILMRPTLAAITGDIQQNLATYVMYNVSQSLTPWASWQLQTP